MNFIDSSTATDSRRGPAARRQFASRLRASTLLFWASAAIAGAEVDIQRLESLAPEARLRETIETLSSLGSRVAGYPGADQAALYVQRSFREIGLKDVTFHKYDISIPMEKGGFLQLASDDRKIELYGMWPNLVRTSTLPDGGIDGRMIDAGSGEFSDLDGIDPEGTIALMDFNSGDNWLNAAYLGVAAVVFVEPASTVYLEAERKFLTMPLDLPRFWVSRRDGEYLRSRIGSGISSAQNTSVHLEYRMDWERRPAWNIMGFIPGYDPLLKDDTFVLEAYYDAMSVVPQLAPGAEQASSITALLELARYFRQNPPPRTVVFLATSAHHLGLRGIDDFIQRYLRKEDPFIERMLIRRVRGGVAGPWADRARRRLLSSRQQGVPRQRGHDPRDRRNRLHPGEESSAAGGR